MCLLVDPALAVGVLRTLARLQGRREIPKTEEQPGRILHEVRFNSTASTAVDAGRVYYGTVDATPLFVMLLGQLSRWGVERSVVDALLPHADRALEWIEHYGDRDGDGYVEYQRATPDGLANQGWKDSWDGVTLPTAQREDADRDRRGAGLRLRGLPRPRRPRGRARRRGRPPLGAGRRPPR